MVTICMKYLQLDEMIFPVALLHISRTWLICFSCYDILRLGLLFPMESGIQR